MRLAERLAHRRAADAVAGHQLQLRLHLAAGRQLAAVDALAQVERDPPIERQARRVRRPRTSYPLSPEMAMPRTKNFWATTNSTTIGTRLTTAPAIISGHLPTNWPWKKASPTVVV